MNTNGRAVGAPWARYVSSIDLSVIPDVDRVCRPQHLKDWPRETWSAAEARQYVFYLNAPNMPALEPDLEKTKLTVQYIDKEKGVIVVADENYEQKDLPIKLAQGAEGLLEPGTVIGVALDGDIPVKLALPTNILAQIKKL